MEKTEENSHRVAADAFWLLSPVSRLPACLIVFWLCLPLVLVPVIVVVIILPSWCKLCK